MLVFGPARVGRVRWCRDVATLSCGAESSATHTVDPTKAPVLGLLKTFAKLVLAGNLGLIVEIGACLCNEWKQSKRAPLLEQKLALRKA